MLKKSLVYICAFLVIANGITAIRMFSHGADAGMYFFDVGQGDSELVLCEGVRILIDTGKDAKASEQLEKLFDDKKYIDILILTHNDTDHVEGTYAVLNRFAVGVVLVGNGDGEDWSDIMRFAGQKNIPIIPIDRGDVIEYKEMRMTVLWPDPLYEARDDNEKSLVLKYTYGGYAVLFTGDITGEAERIIAKLYDMRADVLKVAHHGSKFSSSDEFLLAVSPALSIIEVGKNSYGHPTRDVLDRLKKHGSSVLRTDESGTIRVYEKDGRLHVEAL